MPFLPEKQDETADDSVLDTELLETDGIFDQADALAQKFIASVQQPCRLSFRRDLVRISFFGRVEQSPLPGLSYDKEAEENWQTITCNIGDAFTSSYRKLHSFVSLFSDFPLDEQRMDSVYCILSDLRLLSVAVQSVDNIYETAADLADQLSYFCLSRLGPFYGVRQYEGNAFQILKRYINNDEPNGRDFINYLTGDAEFVYVCSNLYQICAALIDYLCRYKRYDVYSRKPYRYSLRKCPRCGRYFITEDRKIIYCKYVDESGKTCAEWQEIDRKKKFASAERTLAEQLAEKIRRRLYSYRTVVKISRADYTNDPRYKERDELYKLYTKCCKKHSQQSDFAGWVAECAAQLPTSRNESYDKFKEWLLERS